MSWVYSGRVTKDNVKDFHEAFDREVMPKIKEFLKQYDLGENTSFVSYGDNSLDIKISSKYVLGNGAKPWAESNMREDFEHWAKHCDPTEEHGRKVRDFFNSLPQGSLIGRHIHIPGSSKRYPDETFTLTGYTRSAKYPLELTRDRDGKKWSWEMDFDMRFVDYVA